MKLKTTQKITITQARQFEDEQGEKKIKKLNIFSQDDCYWLLDVEAPTIYKGFRAKVKWYQLQEYDTGDPENTTGEMPALMFSENFELNEQELDDMFSATNVIIMPSDSFDEKFNEVLKAAVLHWVGSIRQIFGLDESGFEEVTD